MNRLVLIATLLVSSLSFAFAEDLGPNAQGKLANCLLDGCTTGAGRSMVHVDATFAIAQAIGFRDDVAYWLAAYDEATDLGTYTPFDACGVQLTDTTLKTENVASVVRSNVVTGGVSIHFPLAFSTNSGADLTAAGVTALYPYLQNGVQNPAAENPYDGQLAHFRRWAFSTAPSPTFCADGFTVATPASNGTTGYFAGTSCFSGGTITGKLPLFKNGDASSFSVSTGRQYVFAKTDPKSSQLLSTVMANASGRLYATPGTPTVPPELLRMGIYLHSLQDRVSHQYCHDSSWSSSRGTAGFSENYSTVCTDTAHTQGHLDEIGQTTLPLRDFTALSITYDELKAFYDAFAVAKGWTRSGPTYSKAQLVGVPSSGSGGSFSKTATYVPGVITQPLTVADPSARLAAMNQAVTSLGLVLMPGMSAVCH